MAASGPSVKAIALLVMGLTGVAIALAAYEHFRPARQARPGGRSTLSDRPTAIAPVERQRLRLYFQTADQPRLDVEEREIAGSNRLGERVRACLEELARGPVAESLRALLPSEAPVRHVFLDGRGQVYVDLGASLRSELAGRDSDSQRLVVFSIVNTLLANFEELGAVQLLFEGRDGPRLPGVDLDRPLGARLDLVGTEGPGSRDPAEAEGLEDPET